MYKILCISSVIAVLFAIAIAQSSFSSFPKLPSFPTFSSVQKATVKQLEGLCRNAFSDNFDFWNQTFPKTPMSGAVVDRKKVFVENCVEIMNSNLNATSTFRKALNKYVTWTKAEFQALLGTTPKHVATAQNPPGLDHRREKRQTSKSCDFEKNCQKS